MSLGVRAEDDVTILALKGMFLGGNETDELEAKLKELKEVGNEKLIINLREVRIIGDRILGLLRAAHFNYAKRGAQIKLAHAGVKLRGIFAAANLDTMFDTCEREEDAMKSFVRS